MPTALKVKILAAPVQLAKRQLSVAVTRAGLPTGVPAEMRGDNLELLCHFGDSSPQTVLLQALPVKSSFMATDRTTGAGVIRQVTTNESSAPLTVRLDVQDIQRPPSGNGYLAGTFPDGITKVEGKPSPADIRIHYRPEAGQPGDGLLIAATTSDASGSWRVDGLDPATKYDVVCRRPGYNDLILSDISPVLYEVDPMEVTGTLTVNPEGRAGLVGALEIKGGYPPLTLTASGVPEGLALLFDGTSISASGEVEKFGTYPVALRIKDRTGAQLEILQTWRLIGPPFSEQVLADTPVLYWRLGEQSGPNLGDSSGNGRGARLVGAAGTDYLLGVTGLVDDADKAMRALSNSAYIRSDGTLSLPGKNFTMLVVVQIDEGSTGGRVIGCHDQAAPGTGGNQDKTLYVDAGGYLRAGLWTGSAIATIRSPLPVNDGKKHVIHFCVGDASAELYIDGVSVGTAQGTSTPYTGYVYALRTLQTGWPDIVSGGMKGVIDEIAWFNMRLTAERISAQAARALDL